jgi:drug/metabolite transporter (DMT)-like permease
LALTAALGYGVATWLLGTLVTPQLGSIVPIWLIRLITPCLLVAGAFSFRQTLRLPSVSAWWLIGGVGLLDTVGSVAALRGLATGQIALVGVLISLFSPVTILLALLFLRERLLWSQWLGVGIILVGLVLMH